MTGVVIEYVIEGEANHYTATADTLGLAPGQWPPQLPTSLGDGSLFHLTRFAYSADGVESAHYVQANGRFTLIVWKD